MATKAVDVDTVVSPESGEQGKLVISEDDRLHAMGYEQHMKRGFNFWSMTAFCLTGLGLLPSVGGMRHRGSQAALRD